MTDDVVVRELREIKEILARLEKLMEQVALGMGIKLRE